MAIFKFSNAGGFGTFQRYNDFLAGNPAVIQDAGAYFPLGEFTLASAQASITFDNIPQTYKHLQIRGIARMNTTGNSWVRYKINNTDITNTDTTNANYWRHEVRGNGTSAVTESGGRNYAFLTIESTNLSSTYNAFVFDLLDYTNSNINKTVRTLSGYDLNGSGLVHLNSSQFRNTAAVTRIDLAPDVGSFAANSQFALYGIL